MKSLFGRVNLRVKLLMSYLSVFFIAAVVIVWYTAHTSEQMTYANNVNAVAGMAEKARDNLDRKIEQYEQTMTLCVYNEDLQQLYKNRFRSYYALYRKLTDTFFPFYQGLFGSYVGDMNELCVYSFTGLSKWSSYLNSADSVRGQAWFRQAEKALGVQWNVKDQGLYATCRIDPTDRLRAEEPLGVLYVGINTDALFERYAYIDIPRYTLSLTDARGDEKLFKMVGEISAEEKTVAFQAASQKLGWNLRFCVPERELKAQSIRVLPLNFGAVVLGMLMLLLLITYFTRTLLKGLDRLKNTMLQVNEGRLDVCVDARSRDEIGVLSDTFNGMLKTIRRLLTQTREDERRLSSLEARALRAQIDPHFLYNTLSFINWKLVQAGQDDASEVISQLSTFYRTCLNKGNDFTHVATEMANVRAYIGIQLHLHDNGFRVTYDVPEALTGNLMLSFVLQPLVENAILHGVDKRREGMGELGIRLREEAGKLVFTVTDNGPGITEEALRALRAPADSQTGYGVSNVESRIALCYGQGYGIAIRNRPEGGCEALLTVPVHPDTAVK